MQRDCMDCTLTKEQAMERLYDLSAEVKWFFNEVGDYSAKCNESEIDERIVKFIQKAVRQVIQNNLDYNKALSEAVVGIEVIENK